MSRRRRRRGRPRPPRPAAPGPGPGARRRPHQCDSGRRGRPSRPAACPAGTGRAPPTPAGPRSARPGRRPATGPCAPAGRSRRGGRRRRRTGSSRAAPPGSPRCGGRAASARAGRVGVGQVDVLVADAGVELERHLAARGQLGRPPDQERQQHRVVEPRRLGGLVEAGEGPAAVGLGGLGEQPQPAPVGGDRQSATAPRSMAVPTRSSNPPRNRASDLAVGAPGASSSEARASSRTISCTGRLAARSSSATSTTWSPPAPVSTSRAAVPAWSSSSRR